MSSKKQDRDPDTPSLEWTCGAIGLVLFLGVIVVTAMNGLHQGGPPSFDIERTSMRKDAAGLYHVDFSIVNAGDEAATDVQVAASLKQGDQTVDKREVTIALIPPHSSRDAAVVFAEDPANFDLVVEPLSYLAP